MRPEIETQIHHGYIETTMKDGQMWRVVRPFHHDEWILMPMVSVEQELKEDKERIARLKKEGKPKIPTPADYMDADELRDHYRDDSFNNDPRYTDEET